MDEDELLMRNFFGHSTRCARCSTSSSQVALTAEMTYAQMRGGVAGGAGRPVSTKVLSYMIWRVKGEDSTRWAFILELLR